MKGLLAGEDVLFREGDRERWIHLIHADRDSFINIHDPIPVFMARLTDAKPFKQPEKSPTAGSPPAQAVTSTPTAKYSSNAARASGRHDFNPYTVANTPGCVLHDGESMTSDRVMAHVAPNIVMRIHGQWEAGYGPGSSLGQPGTTEAASQYDAYIRAYAQERGTPADRLYLDVHRGHMVFMKPGEEQLHLRKRHRPHPHRLPLPNHGAHGSHRSHRRQLPSHPNPQRRSRPRPNPRLPTRGAE